ncbi:hypothetical protein [Amycolatopsis palatopharyngis]|uniref:hypothetical protein n=1 Tax=Amycolatopsis palatopharyngis TaxID=187982 RepID=UPI0013BE9495|nr:hypothetical protein [Amycolatopsis palatopharyngis]
MREFGQRCGPRSRRLLAGVLLPVLIVAACTDGPRDGASETTGAPVPERAQTHHPREPVTVLDARPGPELAMAASDALFRSAPIVLVADAQDVEGLATASEIAVRLGAPVLVDSGVHPTDVPSGLRQELTRLSPQAVLAVGTAERGKVQALVGSVPVFAVGSSQDLPADGLPTTKPPEPADLTVLVEAAQMTGAAVATARAAGAEILPVQGTDPRADSAAVEALHADPPATVLALGAGFGPAERLRARLAVAATGRQLPGGGQLMPHGKRLVCLYGHPGAPSLGVLGEQDLQHSISRAKRTAAQYEPLSEVPVVPAFEIIATVAHGEPGADGDYSGESSVASLRPWVEEAGRSGLYVLLDLQPGRARLQQQAQRYEALLRLPHVGLAVDPEWKLGPTQEPLEQIGGIDAAEINETSAWLADLVAEHSLPQKLLVVHQFRLSMIRNESALVTTHDEVSLLIHMDGQGSTRQKDATWNAVVAARPAGVPMGWKNFYDEDHSMLTPSQTMQRRPKPAMISYQ